MGMISEDEAQQRSICMFCKQPVEELDKIEYQKYRWTSLCPSCWADISGIDSIDHTPQTAKDIRDAVWNNEDQLEFELSSDSPIPIICNGALSISWLMMHHPKLLIGSHITVENYGLTAKFTIIPPTWEASEKIMNIMRKDREQRNRQLRPGSKGNAPTRYQL